MSGLDVISDYIKGYSKEDVDFLANVLNEGTHLPPFIRIKHLTSIYRRANCKQKEGILLYMLSDPAFCNESNRILPLHRLTYFVDEVFLNDMSNEVIMKVLLLLAHRIYSRGNKFSQSSLVLLRKSVIEKNSSRLSVIVDWIGNEDKYAILNLFKLMNFDNMIEFSEGIINNLTDFFLGIGIDSNDIDEYFCITKNTGKQKVDGVKANGFGDNSSSRYLKNEIRKLVMELDSEKSRRVNLEIRVREKQDELFEVRRVLDDLLDTHYKVVNDDVNDFRQQLALDLGGVYAEFKKGIKDTARDSVRISLLQNTVNVLFKKLSDNGIDL